MAHKKRIFFDVDGAIGASVFFNSSIYNGAPYARICLRGYPRMRIRIQGPPCVYLSLFSLCKPSLHNGLQ